MNWSLSQFNLICYGSSDSEIFLNKSGIASFPRERLFEYTSKVLENCYQDDLTKLAGLPTLVVAEADPKGKPRTPAFFSRIYEIREVRKEIRFRFQHLCRQFSSEEVFSCGHFDIRGTEYYRTHWAVKEGNVLEGLFSLLENQSGKGAPKFFNVEKWPPSVLDHIAVMMPFEEKFNMVYEAIKAACDELFFVEARRVDEIYGPTKIVDDIFTTIIQSRVVISDLTGRNPNVLYETGLAHACNCEVILIVQNDQDVPFDLRQFRFIKYLPNKEGMEKLRKDIKKSIQSIDNVL